MSQENVEIVRGIFDNWATGDFGAGLANLDPYVIFGVRPPFPELAVIVGPNEISEFMRRFLDSWEHYAAEARVFRTAGDTLLADALQHGEGKASQIEIEQRFF